MPHHRPERCGRRYDLSGDIIAEYQVAVDRRARDSGLRLGGGDRSSPISSQYGRALGAGCQRRGPAPAHLYLASVDETALNRRLRWTLAQSRLVVSSARVALQCPPVAAPTPTVPD